MTFAWYGMAASGVTSKLRAATLAYRRIVLHSIRQFALAAEQRPAYSPYLYVVSEWLL